MKIMKNSKKITYIVAFSLISVGFLFLIFNSLKSSSVYFLNVSEALAKTEKVLKNARLFGIVGKEIVKDRVGIRFQLLDKNNPEDKITVKYSGKVPDTFKQGSEVIVEGSLYNKIFNAKTLMTKCPSKYQKKS